MQTIFLFLFCMSFAINIYYVFVVLTNWKNAAHVWREKYTRVLSELSIEKSKNNTTLKTKK
jgi:hypothetical protein